MENPHEIRLSKKRIGDEPEMHTKLPPAPELRGKMVYLELDDEVVAVYDRIKRVKGSPLYLVIPKRAIVLQSLVNLKILKRKAQDLGKKLILVTNDASGMNMAKSVGFEVLDKFPHAKEEGPKKIPQPHVPSPKNIVPRPTRLMERKLSLSELMRRGSTTSLPIVARVREFFRKRKKQKKHTEIIIVTPSKQALITLIIVSSAVLLVIAYIALPGATITLTPAEARIDQPVNVTLADYEKNRSLFSENPELIIPSYKITPPPVRRAIVQAATGKLFEGTNATGTVTLTNLTNHAWPLVEKTRLQTADGIVYRIQRDVTVPASSGSSPGTLDITVVADEFDASGQTVGERGNIGQTRFFLPGLKNSENRKNLYGENKAPITGGTTKVSKMVTEEDVAAARERAKKEITALAKDSLASYLNNENREKNSSLVLLPDPRTIEISEPKIEVPANIAGRAMDQFEIMAEVNVSGTAFVKKELLSILKSEMMLRKSPGKTIVSISEDSLSYKIFDVDKDAGKIKITATIRGREQYDLDPQSEEGAKLVKRIEDHILGKDKDEAITFMQNLPEIDQVEIKSWPFWAPTVPTVADNIKFVVKQETPPLPGGVETESGI